MKSLSSVAAILSLVVVGSALPAHGQNRQLQDALQGASRVDCSFSTLVTGDWNDDGSVAEVADVEFTAAFFDIDVETGTAEAEGRFGASYIIVRYAEGYLHFMQTLNSGPLYLTTILAQPTADGRLKAIHTRHEFTQVRLPGFTSRPEMYLGDCSVE